ncbi:MAG: TRAP transporter small permease [Saccharospirillum sp.]|nr:TRAP transporter small permease [Saccharospirillum sp.]
MKHLIRACDIVAGLAMTFMMVVVASRILTRILFAVSDGELDWMFPGAIELASYSLLVVVFASFPRAIDSGLVNVDLFTEKFPLAINALLDRFWALVSALIALGIAYQNWGQMISAYRRGHSTQDLDIPLYFFYGYIVAATLAFALVAIWVATRRRPQ